MTWSEVYPELVKAVKEREDEEGSPVDPKLVAAAEHLAQALERQGVIVPDSVSTLPDGNPLFLWYVKKGDGFIHQYFEIETEDGGQVMETYPDQRKANFLQFVLARDNAQLPIVRCGGASGPMLFPGVGPFWTEEEKSEEERPSPSPAVCPTR